MKKDIEKYELIERYLKGTLSPEEQQQVEQQIQSDKDFALEVEQHRTLVNFVTDGSLLEIKDQVQNIHLEFKNSFFRRIFNNRGTLIISGIVIVSAIVMYFAIQKPITKTSSTVTKITEKPVASAQDKETRTISTGKPQSTVVVKEKQTGQPILSEIHEPETPLSVQEIVPAKNEVDEEVAAVVNKVESKKEPEIKNLNEAQPVSKEDSFDCSQVQLSAEVFVENSCIHGSTGEIKIESKSISGGTAPYRISIDNKKNYNTKLKFEKLASGSYTLWLTDKNNCSEKLGTYWVNTKDCSEEGYEYVFAPDKQEKWKIPQVEGAVLLQIFNQQGNIVYELEINDYSTFYWDGTSFSGNTMPMGVYSFRIISNDNSKTTGNVTIVK